MNHNFDVEYYTIQYRISAEGPWLKPNVKPKPIKKKDEWGWASFSNFSFNPLLQKKRGCGNDLYWKWPAAEQEVSDIRQKCGSEGWYSLKFAVRALNRVRELDSLGEHDYRDTYRNKCRSVRHEYRIVKVHHSRKVLLPGLPPRPSRS